MPFSIIGSLLKHIISQSEKRKGDRAKGWRSCRAAAASVSSGSMWREPRSNCLLCILQCGFGQSFRINKLLFIYFKTYIPWKKMPRDSSAIAKIKSSWQETEIHSANWTRTVKKKKGGGEITVNFETSFSFQSAKNSPLKKLLGFKELPWIESDQWPVAIACPSVSETAFQGQFFLARN